MNQNWNLNWHLPAAILIMNHPNQQYLLKIPRQKTFRKWLPQMFPFKKCIFKIAPSKKNLKFLPKKYIFKISSSKMHFQDCFLKQDILRTVFKQNVLIFSFNLFFIRIIRTFFKVIRNMSNYLLWKNTLG